MPKCPKCGAVAQLFKCDACGDVRCDSGPVREMLTAERLSVLYDYPLQVFERDGQLCLLPE